MQSGAGRILTVRPCQTNYFFLHRHAGAWKEDKENVDNILAINDVVVMNEVEKKVTKL
jgi:hypothetical protein